MKSNHIFQIGLSTMAMVFAQSAYAAVIPVGIQSVSMRVNAYHDSDSSSKQTSGSVVLRDSVSASDTGVIQNALGDTTHYLLVEAKASAFAGTTSLGASAFSTAQSAIGVSGFYGTGATAFSQAQLTQYFQVDAPGLTGQNGIMQVPLLISGDISINGDGGEPFGYTQARAYALLWATGLPANNNCRSAASACNEQSYDESNGVISQPSTIPGTLTLNIPIRFGDIGSFSLQLWASADATAVAANNGTANQNAEANFLNTVTWGGISNILDKNGNIVSNWAIQSAPGVDLASPVPVPAAFYLFLTGLAGGLKLCNRKTKSQTVTELVGPIREA